jgi:hypothetical protein
MLSKLNRFLDTEPSVLEIILVALVLMLVTFWIQ